MSLPRAIADIDRFATFATGKLHLQVGSTIMCAL